MVKNSTTLQQADLVMASPDLAVTSPGYGTPGLAFGPEVKCPGRHRGWWWAGVWRSGPGDALPTGWTATVRRTWWGAWSAYGFYDFHDGPQVMEPPLQIVAGWCWRRSTAIEQVRYWIEDAIAEEEEAAHQRTLDNEDSRLLAWDEAILENADRTAHQLLARIGRETTLANTPLDHLYPDSGHTEDTRPQAHVVEAEDRFAKHLLAHPELRSLPRWEFFIRSLEEERDLDYEAALVEDDRFEQALWRLGDHVSSAEYLTDVQEANDQAYLESLVADEEGSP